MAAILFATSAAQSTNAAGAARIALPMEVENGTIVPTRSDRDAGGWDHAVPIAWSGAVDEAGGRREGALGSGRRAEG